MKIIVDFIYRLATGARHIRIILTPIFGALFLLFVSLTIFLALKADEVFNLSGPVRYPWNYILSLPLLGIGAFLFDGYCNGIRNAAVIMTVALPSYSRSMSTSY